MNADAHGFSGPHADVTHEIIGAGFSVGLILNFKRPKLAWERLILEND